MKIKKSNIPTLQKEAPKLEKKRVIKARIGKGSCAICS